MFEFYLKIYSDSLALLFQPRGSSYSDLDLWLRIPSHKAFLSWLMILENALFSSFSYGDRLYRISFHSTLIWIWNQKVKQPYLLTKGRFGLNPYKTSLTIFSTLTMFRRYVIENYWLRETWGLKCKMNHFCCFFFSHH